jgi:hypothetical protein
MDRRVLLVDIWYNRDVRGAGVRRAGSKEWTSSRTEKR